MRLYDHPRMEQMNIYFLFNFLSFKQLMFLYNNNAIGYWTDITFFTSRSTDKVRSSLYVELMLHPNMPWIKTGLESFLHQSGQVCLGSVCMLSFYFLHEEEIFSYRVNWEWEGLLHEKKIYG